MTVSARCAKALTGINPRGIFGSFLGKQKGTRPAGRNSLKQKISAVQMDGAYNAVC